MSPIQCGFRKNRSTTVHLVALESAILNTYTEKKEAVGIFFDQEKAYD